MKKGICIALTVVVATISFAVFSVETHAETHVVKMLNKDPDNKKKRNVFIPSVLKIKPGDTVHFVAVNKGHNTQSIKGMIPKGAKTWRSKFSKDFKITFDKPGVYGYRCAPHYVLGMVGLIVVEGENWKANMAAAKKVKQHGRAKKIFNALWRELDKAK
ncbi:MAG: pseudoazurin [Rhodospirillaceae bacterium]|nr:pseudoazurin [Rhodospirillaceae bacterium]|tara:strand:+ start:22831 stop:23307 length:477 start_codon:yes stop_codon:yes gene_type:complete